MSRYLDYNPDQNWLLPPSVEEELGSGHLALFVHRVIERLNLSKFEEHYSENGRPAYPPQMLLKVWLYAYAQGLTSSRRLEQRIREDLGFRLLAGNLKPDYWVLNEFRKRHRRGLNDVFTQVLEQARQLGFARLGKVAIDSTRVQANASADRSDSPDRLRQERARLRRKIRQWQQQCDDNNEDAAPSSGIPVQWEKRLEQIQPQLQELQKSQQKRGSRTDPESRYLRRRGGFVLGYTAEVAVSEDHWIVGHRVHQKTNDTASLEAMIQQCERQCGQRPEVVMADTGYYSMGEIEKVEAAGTTAYVPDQLIAKEWITGEEVSMNRRQQRRHPGLKELRERMRQPAVRACYARRKTMVEPVFGVLKQQRGMRQFRRRGLAAVSTEWTLAATAYNLTRLFHCQARR